MADDPSRNVSRDARRSPTRLGKGADLVVDVRVAKHR
jgi:hypothetical protein